MQRVENQKTVATWKKAKNIKIAIVTSEFNKDVTFKLEEGAITELIQGGFLEKNITVVPAPGGFEIPFVCQQLARSKKYKGIIAIGCVIRGDTDHYVYIANEATRGVMDVMLKENIPIANAILTVNNLEQAVERAIGDNNKGAEAASALIQILKTFGK